MNLIFPITWIAWFLSEILLHRTFRPKRIGARSKDKQTNLFIWITVLLSITTGVLSSIYFDMAITPNHYAGYIGLAIIATGIFFRIYAIRILGKFFTVTLSIHDNHFIVKDGPFRFLRHPSYTGSLLSFLGMGVSLNNWISLVIIFVPVLFSFINRINIEEKLLLDKFGEEYEEYQRKTKKLIPGIY